MEQAEKRVVPRPIEVEMEKSYIDYAMSVIVGRALPDVRDGLKPVQRRILYAMNDMGLDSSKPHKKCARITGETLGKYHPHGDVAVYEALVRMAQDFSMRYCLIDGQGNFGSVDGDAPAAMRYTECRLDRRAEEMLQDIDKNTVKFVDNFDGTLKEPEVLPAKLPNLLINGSSGIAVGMATNIPPHNLSEIVDGLILLIDNPDAGIMDLMEVIQGPDFPTGGIIYGRKGIVDAYSTGRGLVQIRAKTSIEEMEHDKKRIVVTEIPYMVNKSALIESIADLIKNKKIEGVVDLRDESDREGMRIVLELRRDVMEDIVLNQLFAHTQMQSTFGIINLALVNGEPRVLTLKESLQNYINFREEVVRARTQFDLDKARQRAHIVEGLLIAIDHLDDVIGLITKSKEVEDAKSGLMRRYLLSEEQAKAILDMKLQKLTGLEMKGLREEKNQLVKTIHELEEIVASRQKVLEIIKKELIELKEKYADSRRTEIQAEAEELDIEDLIPVEDVVVTMTRTGYVKTLPLNTYRMQRRGGIGLVGIETKEEDYVVDSFVTCTHDFILFFTNKGRVYWLKAYKIPSGGRHSRGKPIVNLLPRLENGERISAMVPVKEFDEKMYLLFATKNGCIKKTKLYAFRRPTIAGIRAIKLAEGDELIETKLSKNDEEVILATRNGYANRFSVQDVRSMGRVTRGVRGMRLKKDDKVVSMALARDPDVELLTITESGHGKRTKVSKYRKTRRGSRGVLTTRIDPKSNAVVAVREVKPDEELLITSLHGMVIRTTVRGIRQTGRFARGVRVMKLHPGDKVKAVAKLMKEEELKTGIPSIQA